jgi:GTP-binding protein SAR1
MSSLWDWIVSFKNWLVSLGFNYNKKGKLLFLGLDYAGKTTLLYLLKENKIIQAPPTGQGSCEELVLNKITFTTYDVGGHSQVRKVWSEYFFAVDAIVFIIDVSSRERFAEAKFELDAILCNEDILACPILVLGNKIDAENAADEEQVKAYFNLGHLLTGKAVSGKQTNGDMTGATFVRPIELYMTSCTKRQGYGDGFRWLSNNF